MFSAYLLFKRSWAAPPNLTRFHQLTLFLFSPLFPPPPCSPGRNPCGRGIPTTPFGWVFGLCWSYLDSLDLHWSAPFFTRSKGGLNRPLNTTFSRICFPWFSPIPLRFPLFPLVSLSAWKDHHPASLPQPCVGQRSCR